MKLRRPLAVALLAVVPAAAGCGVGKGNYTDKEITVLQNSVNDAVGPILIRSAYLTPTADTGASASPTTDPSASGTPSATPQSPGAASPSTSPSGTSHLVVTLVNTGTTADQLTNVTLTGGGQVSPGGGGSLSLAPDTSVRFVDPAMQSGGSTLDVSGGGSLVPGTVVSVTFTFANAGATTIQVPVNPTPGTTASATPPQYGTGPTAPAAPDVKQSAPETGPSAAAPGTGMVSTNP